LAAAGLLALVGVAWLGTLSATVPLIGLALLLWFAVEWLLFAIRFRANSDRLVVHRTLLQGGRPAPALWAGATARVRVTVENAGRLRWPLVFLEDRLPAEFPGADPGNRVVANLGPGESSTIEYELKPEHPGALRFEGVRVRVADPAGLFYRRLFLRDPVEYLVLPPLTDDEGRHRARKTFNTLPPPGVHRLKRPGSGSELLDLRDYRPGDPPKMIAWKPSARRDRLITKEYESEVPVRYMLFLDGSTGGRVGPPGKAPVVRLSHVAAGIAQAAAASRDLVGLAVFDESGVDLVKPARTHAHMVRILRKLGEAAAQLPNPGHTDPDLLARYAYPVGQELYPELLSPDVNSRPFGLFWKPIADSRWLWLVLGLLACPGLLVSRDVLESVAWVAATLSPPGKSWIWMIAMVALPGVLATLIWLIHGARGLFPPRAPRTARRKQLAALYANLDDAGPAAIERYLADDLAFADRTTRFLLDHRVRTPLVLTDKEGRYRFRSEQKLEVLAAAMVRSVSTARDNELFVVLADLAELADSLEPLVRAARLARARHHQVLVLVAWPPDVPPPEAVRTPDAAAHPGAADRLPSGLRIANLVRAVVASRYRRGYEEVRTALGRAGAAVVRVEDGDPVRLVLDRLDRIRGAGVRR
jgi:uncharacterized protein (DUF58 family)